MVDMGTLHHDGFRRFLGLVSNCSYVDSFFLCFEHVVSLRFGINALLIRRIGRILGWQLLIPTARSICYGSFIIVDGL